MYKMMGHTEVGGNRWGDTFLFVVTYEHKCNYNFPLIFFSLWKLKFWFMPAINDCFFQRGHWFPLWLCGHTDELLYFFSNAGHKTHTCQTCDENNRCAEKRVSNCKPPRIHMVSASGKTEQGWKVEINWNTAVLKLIGIYNKSAFWVLVLYLLLKIMDFIVQKYVITMKKKEILDKWNGNYL